MRTTTLLLPRTTNWNNYTGDSDESPQLTEVAKDREILWPPMVVIMNTLLKEENQKWVGMGNKELVEYFQSYNPVRACHSYGPKGHKGMSLLIFEASAGGYTEAERLSKNFEIQGMDRDAWRNNPKVFCSDGKRQLYGYMATAGDMDIFNKHLGKSKVKFELVSYQEKVVNQLKQMHEDNQQLHSEAQSSGTDRDRTQSSGTALHVRMDHEARKKKKLHADFFKTLDTLTVEQINKSSKWKCPLCKEGPGSKRSYCNLQSLVTHAKTKGSDVKIHRDLAKVLEEELCRRGVTAGPSGRAFGEWKGVDEV